MLQDTELWSVLEVSYYTRSQPLALPHGEEPPMLCRLGLPRIDSEFVLTTV